MHVWGTSVAILLNEEIIGSHFFCQLYYLVPSTLNVWDYIVIHSRFTQCLQPELFTDGACAVRDYRTEEKGE